MARQQVVAVVRTHRHPSGVDQRPAPGNVSTRSIPGDCTAWNGLASCVTERDRALGAGSGGGGGFDGWMGACALGRMGSGGAPGRRRRVQASVMSVTAGERSAIQSDIGTSAPHGEIVEQHFSHWWRWTLLALIIHEAA